MQVLQKTGHRFDLIVIIIFTDEVELNFCKLGAMCDSISQFQKHCTTFSAADFLPVTTQETHSLATKVYHSVQHFQNWATKQHRSGSKNHKTLNAANLVTKLRRQLYHPATDAFTITSKLETFVTSFEVQMFNIHSNLFQPFQIPQHIFRTS